MLGTYNFRCLSCRNNVYFIWLWWEYFVKKKQESNSSTPSNATSSQKNNSTTTSSKNSNASSITTNSKTNTATRKSIYNGEIRICTDGSDGTLIPDNDHCSETAYTRNGASLDATKVAYVVIPIGDTSARLGDTALLINHDTGMSVECVIGDRGPRNNGWGEVSIKAIWDTGNPEHMTAKTNEGLSKNYEIIIYPGLRYYGGN